jgi:N-methylhydantoinase A
MDVRGGGFQHLEVGAELLSLTSSAVGLRFAVDTGGTFTDLVLEHPDGRIAVHKAPTTPEDPTVGIVNVLEHAAEALNVSLCKLLSSGDFFVHGTTRATNAIVTEQTARTAFLTTQGHPDVLLWREGGRPNAFDFDTPFPRPYVPRRLTFEVPERISASGEVVRPLDDAVVVEIAERLVSLEVEAAGVCLLWSIVNSAHERRVRDIVADVAPDIAVTLSHELNPCLREYRRASSTCIDASLKPLMSSYLRGLEARLRAEGYEGAFMVMTSAGGVLPSQAVAAAPIHTINSGPAGAPIAARAALRDAHSGDTAIVADTGGTTFDVSLIRRGQIPWTRETWLGRELLGHMTGFPSVDIKSVGAGGGSLAWVDDGGLLHVGPQSAGSEPGPACYGRGGEQPTVTDACVVLGLIDPDQFLGGEMTLDAKLAQDAIGRHVAAPLAIPPVQAASAVLDVATQHMVAAIEQITVNQGIEPTAATLVAGGGAAGLNAVMIARRLGVVSVLFPAQAAVVSAFGMMLSDLGTEFSLAGRTTTGQFDHERVNDVLAQLDGRARRWARENRIEPRATLTFSVEARYPAQIWELDLELPEARIDSAEQVEAMREAFHALHEEVFGIRDAEAEVELLAWRVRVSGGVRDKRPVAVPAAYLSQPGPPRMRRVYLGSGWAEVEILVDTHPKLASSVLGPVIIENAATTILVPGDATVTRRASGSLAVELTARDHNSGHVEEMMAQ